MKSPRQNCTGSNQCGRPHCKTSFHIKTGNSFMSAVTGEKLYAKVTTGCKTSNIVYLIKCQICRKQCIAEIENPLHIRLNGHHSDYHRKLPDKPVAEHFSRPGHIFNELTVMVIKVMYSAKSNRQKHRESYWIYMYTFWSLAPEGLNSDP